MIIAATKPLRLIPVLMAETFDQCCRITRKPKLQCSFFDKVLHSDNKKAYTFETFGFVEAHSCLALYDLSKGDQLISMICERKKC